MSDFAANLKQFRKRKNYSQATLARKLNYGHTTIANYESGRNEPSIDDLIKIAIILDISLDELVGKNPSKKEECFLHEFQKLSEKKSESYIGFDKSTSTLEERLQARLRRLSPLRSCAHQKRSLSTPFLYLFLYTSKENLTPFSSCISPFSSSSQSGFSSRFGKAVSAG